MYIEERPLIKSSLAIKLKLEKKTFSLQFLPECFKKLSEQKYVTFNEIRLKSDYLIDIVHNLILKFYFKKENRFALNSKVLKDKYGYTYNYYIAYLVELGILHLKSNHLKGVSSRIYSLSENIFSNKINRYKNYDKFLLKKFKLKFVDMSEIDKEVETLIDEKVKEKLVDDLLSVEIDHSRAVFYLDSLKYDDIDIYNRNLYSVECINEKHIFYHFDLYGRMHTNFTILKSFVRKNCLLIDGLETCELDIHNSQPLFLTKLISESGSKWVNPKELELFSYLTFNGKYYQYIMDMLKESNKKKAKELTYKVLFGRNMANSKADKAFISLFPTIHRFIKLYKIEKGDYRILAYDLQKSESNLIFNIIIKNIMVSYPHIKVITIHDSIVIPRIYKEEVTNIFESELRKEFNI